jgi:hypothetical protein
MALQAGDKFIGALGASGQRLSVLDGGDSATKLGTCNCSGGELRNVIIEDFAMPVQQGPTGSNLTDWLFDNIESRFNASDGLQLQDDSVLRNSYMHHNTEIGIGGQGDNILIENNEIAFNGEATASGRDGGSKWVNTVNMTARGNYVHDNEGPGLWTDGSNPGALYEDNLVEGNTGAGIFHELGGTALIQNNTVRCNAGAGEIYIANSRGTAAAPIIVRNNTVGQHCNPNVASLAAKDDPNRSLRLGYVRFENNQVTAENRLAGVFGTSPITAPGIEFVSNDYFSDLYGTGGTGWRTSETNLTWAQWQALGYDVTGTRQPASSALFASAILSTSEVPETVPHPGINGDNGYVIGVTNLDTRTLLWRAPYLYDTPYADFTGWLPGDRVGYGCGYGFLEYNGEIVGRFTFRAIPDAASYMRINDSYMEEGVRYYDGSLTPPGTVQVPAFECPEVSESYAPSTADERPVVVFWQEDQALEIRDYRTTDAAPGVTFRVAAEIREPFQVTSSVSGTHTVNSRVSVVAMDGGVPVAVVYYDALGSGSMFPPVEAEEGPNPDDCNLVVSMSQGRQVYAGQPGGMPPVSPLEALTGEQWMFAGSGGKKLNWWTDPNHWTSLGTMHRCAPDAEIDRVVFIFDPEFSGQPSDDGTTMRNHLNQVLAITAARYPAAETDLVMLVGAEGHVSCSPVVKAAQTHANRIDQLTLPEAGIDIDIPCSEYSDTTGHLNTAGAINANGQLGAFYSGG